MESYLRFSDIFEKFDDTSDAATWLQRTKVIAKIQDVELTVLYPVLLLSDAYAVYDGLGEEDKKDASKIEDVLLQAFSLDAFAAYELFTKLKMSNEGRVGVFLADLKPWRVLRGCHTRRCDWRLSLDCRKQFLQDLGLRKRQLTWCCRK